MHSMFKYKASFVKPSSKGENLLITETVTTEQLIKQKQIYAFLMLH